MDVDVDYYCKGNEIMLIFICEKIFYFNDFYYIFWKYEKRLIWYKLFFDKYDLLVILVCNIFEE